MVDNSDSCISPEAADYVPRFLAAAIIMRHPEAYGFAE